MNLTLTEKLSLYIASDEGTKLFMIIFLTVLFGSIIGLFVWFFVDDAKNAPKRQKDREEIFRKKMSELRSKAGAYADMAHLTPEDEAAMTTVQKSAWLQIGLEKALYETSWENIDFFGSEKLSVKLKAMVDFFVWFGAVFFVFVIVAYFWQTSADAIEKTGNDTLMAAFMIATTILLLLALSLSRRKLYFDKWKNMHINKSRKL